MILRDLCGSIFRMNQGGLHESILGIGILTGPLAGDIGSMTGAETEGAKWAIIGVAVTVTVVGMTMTRGPRRACLAGERGC
ncbi:MAG: hypothetical protein V1929_01085 [bacterium]